MDNNTKIKGPFRKVLYGISAVLVFFYVLVLYFGLEPRVVLEYKMYYITHELTEWPGYGNLTCEFGKKEYFTENTFYSGEYVNYDVGRRRGAGWHTSGRFDGTWSNNKKTSILYYVFDEDTNNLKFNIEINDYLTKYGYVRSDATMTMQEAMLLKKQRVSADRIVNGKIQTAIIAATDEGNSHRFWIRTVINKAHQVKEAGEELTLLKVASCFPSKSSKRASYTGREFVAPSTDGSCSVSVYLGDELIGTFNQPGEYEFSVDSSVIKDKLYELKFVTDKDTSFLLWSIQVTNE